MEKAIRMDLWEMKSRFPRVYKKAVPHEKVLEMILHGECGQFNPILIECLQEISSRIRSECYDEEQET